jgi:hypothetical protein
MAFPQLVQTASSVVLGQTYSLPSLFTLVPGTGPNGETDNADSFGFGPYTPGVQAGPNSPPPATFNGTPDFFGYITFHIDGPTDLEGGAQPFSSGTVTFTQPDTILSGFLNFEYTATVTAPNGQLVQEGFDQAVAESFEFRAQSPSALFTSGADTVNFNNLTSAQQSAIAGGADLYHGLGGNDVVTLPSVANYNVSLGSAGRTLNWNPSQTFSTGSLAGDTYSVTGSDGSYNVALGAGSDTVTIDGNGKSNITAGSGSDTITINGTGTNSVAAGSGPETLAIAGGGTLQVNGNLSVGSATIGANSTLELNGAANGGPITFSLNGVSTSQNETLKIDGATMPTNVIKGFTVGDTIDLAGVPYIAGAVGTTGGIAVISTGNFLSVTEGSIKCQLSLDPTQSFVGQSCSLSPDGQGGTDVKLVDDPTPLQYLLFSDLAYDLTPGASLPFFTPTAPLFSSFSNLPAGVISSLNGFTEGASTVSNAGLTALTFVDNTPGTPDYKDVVVAFRGSVTAHDWFFSDRQIATGSKPAEFDAAVNLVVQQEETAFPISQGYSYFVTGHSLGAAEAEDVAAVLGLGGDTFAALSVSKILTAGGVVSNGANLTDYNITNDPFVNFTAASGQQVGTVVPLSPVKPGSDLFGLLEHRIANYGQALVNAGLIPRPNPLPLDPPTSTSSVSSNGSTNLSDLIAQFVPQNGSSARVPDATLGGFGDGVFTRTNGATPDIAALMQLFLAAPSGAASGLLPSSLLAEEQRAALAFQHG